MTASPIRAAEAADADPARHRILLFSERHLEQPKWQVAQYEFEDVIRSVDSVHLIAPPGPGGSEFRQLAGRARNALRRAVGLRDRRPLGRVALEEEYDLFFAVFHFPWHTVYLEQLADWRRRCRAAVCFLIETWSSHVHKDRAYYELLADFDRIFVFNAASATAIADVTGRPCEFMPVGVDMDRFCPFPDPPARTIDCYSFGRRSAVTHEALVRLAAAGELFYVYDTMGNAPLLDYHEHRQLVASMMQRSRYFFAYRINDDPSRHSRTRGEEALVARYFEGIAGGAILLGTRTHCPEFDRCFDWPDALIPIPYDTPEIGAILEELDAQPERLALARRRNVVHSLRRYDWVHRWAQVLDAVGLPHPPAMRDRLTRLNALAATVEAVDLAVL